MATRDKGRKQPVQWRFDPAITRSGCIAVIQELADTGKQPASLKLALWTAALSPHQTLVRNGRLARILAHYVDRPLPAGDDLWHALQPARARVFRSQIASLRAVERLDQTGELDMAAPVAGWSYADWTAWREDLIHIPGLHYKTVSFAGLLMQPLTCQLVPVDMWVLRRLGYGDRTPQTRRAYLAIEHEVIAERDREQPLMPLGAWHWFKWSEARQRAGAEPLSERPESHAALSPRDYPAPPHAVRLADVVVSGATFEHITG